MTRNEADKLERCIYSILNTVLIDVEIYIVDNASSDPKHLLILSKLKLLDGVKVIHNSTNRWVLGLNKTITEVKNTHGGEYFFLTDGDIDFTECMPTQCWLTFLITKMNANKFIGKLGFSLSWHYLEKYEELSDILLQERNLYSETKKIDELYISQIDTTATIFRWDWSVEGSSLLYPLHIKYLRPELYSCRTSRDICVEHLGWEDYQFRAVEQEYLDEKVMCFTVVGGHIKQNILNQCSKRVKLFNYLLAIPFKRIWAIRRYWFVLMYCFRKSRKGFDGQISK
jgi:glycosyltransferase involved in cell wall biosynthesis